jgi:hypothetical protein
MKNYFLLASTAVFLSANVANAQVVMDEGRVTLDVYAGVKALGISIDEDHGKQNISLGTTIVDKSKHNPWEPLVSMDPYDGQLYGGPGFVAHDFNHTFGSFRIKGITQDIMNRYGRFLEFPGVGYHDIQAGSGTNTVEGIRLACQTSASGVLPEVVYEPGYEFYLVEYSDKADVIIGGLLYVGNMDESFSEAHCEGQLEVMLGFSESE